MKILYGVCGIGNGHIFRQLPQILSHLKEGHRLLIYAYQESYSFFKKMETEYPNLRVLPVAVPYLKGSKEGLDFEESLKLEVNEQSFFRVNTQAMQETKRAIGKPDLVITDYEPISAQYAYLSGATLHTFDQQSKFLFGDFPREINGCSFEDEVERLRLFFPKADKRIIASFFDFKLNPVPPGEEIVIVRPPMSGRTIAIKEKSSQFSFMHPSSEKEILVYLSPQLLAPQNSFPDSQSLMSRLFDFCGVWAREGYHFHCYLPKTFYSNHFSDSNNSNIFKDLNSNIKLYSIGQSSYDDHLASCSGIISTAGHGLLSEAVYLNKKTLAISMDLYEQQLNGRMIQEMSLGVHSTIHSLNQNDMDRFINCISL